jgi:exoribonuclease R
MIPGIIEFSSKIKYGFTSKKLPLYLFRPIDNSDLYIVGSSGKYTRNQLALAMPQELSKSNTLNRANLVKIIGECGDIKSETLALQYRYLNTTPWKNIYLNTPIITSRRVNGYSFNVDPPGCEDIDDVITIGDDGYIYIVIANVYSWIHANPHLYKLIESKGATIYEPDSRIPLIPMENQCSLIPGELRDGVALKFKFIDNEIHDIEFENVEIVNNRSFTYESIYQSPYVDLLKKLSSCIAGYTVDDSHEWIEQIMKFYNCQSASLLATMNRGILRHQPPPSDKYKSIDLKFLDMKTATYTTDYNLEHSSIGTKYCHATSPIRRVVDIVNQNALMNVIDFDFDISKINSIFKNIKKYERETFFLNKLQNPGRTIRGIVINDHRVYVPEWRRIVTCNNEFVENTHVYLKYSLDMNRTTWKKRMVFQAQNILDINDRE